MPKKFKTIDDRRKYQKKIYNKTIQDPAVRKSTYDKNQRIRRERRAWFADLKKSYFCKRCGIDDFRVLDFHHRGDENKLNEVSNMAQRGCSKQKILDEIQKCDCLCANCHRILHWEEKNLREE